MDLGFFQRFVSDCKSDIVRDITILQKYLFSSGILVLSVNVLQLPLIFRHLLYWTKPREQSKILLIILIPSIIGIASFIALHANEDSKTLFLVLDTFKECAVGLGLALYLSLLYTYMDINTAEHSETEIRFKIGGRVICNVFPVTLFQPRYVLLNNNNLKIHKYWTWQFVVIRLVCSFLMIVLQLLDVYPVWLSWAFFSISNFSVSLAFYTVVAFYQAFIEDFTADENYEKCLFFRGIVFVCFGQVLVLLFAGCGVLKVLAAIIKANHFWWQLCNDLVIVEMVIFTGFLPMAFSIPVDSDLPIRTNFAAPKPALLEVYNVASAA